MTDILVKYKSFPALEIELASNSVAVGYKQLVSENVARESAIFRDQCRYTAEYFEHWPCKSETYWDGNGSILTTTILKPLLYYTNASKNTLVDLWAI